MQINVANIISDSIRSTMYPFFPYMLVVLLLLIGISIIRYIKLAKSGIFDIDRLSGEEFEYRLIILFEKLGYQVKHVGNQKGDYGVDLVLEKDSARIALQAKCYKKWHVGEDAVREVLAGKNMYQCSDAWVVTNSTFTNMAIKLAKVNSVKLISRSGLITLLSKEQNAI